MSEPLVLLLAFLAIIGLMAAGAYVYNNFWPQPELPRPVDPEVRLDMERIRANREMHCMKSQIDRHVQWAKREAERKMREY